MARHPKGCSVPAASRAHRLDSTDRRHSALSDQPLDVVLRGDATIVVWLKSALTYLVPFVVSNVGILVAIRTGNSHS
jgi:hypothetical protein